LCARRFCKWSCSPWPALPSQFCQVVLIVFSAW
jgi:hypothetical protein